MVVTQQYHDPVHKPPPLFCLMLACRKGGGVFVGFYSICIGGGRYQELGEGGALVISVCRIFRPYPFPYLIAPILLWIHNYHDQGFVHCF